MALLQDKLTSSAQFYKLHKCLKFDLMYNLELMLVNHMMKTLIHRALPLKPAIYSKGYLSYSIPTLKPFHSVKK